MSIEGEQRNSQDLNRLAATGGDGVRGLPETSASPSGKSAATLEVELKAAKRTIHGHNAAWLILVVILWTIVDYFIFQKITAWAAILVFAALEAIVVFLLAFLLGLTELITLFWAGMRTYGKKEPGDPPNSE